MKSEDHSVPASTLSCPIADTMTPQQINPKVIVVPNSVWLEDFSYNINEIPIKKESQDVVNDTKSCRANLVERFADIEFTGLNTATSMQPCLEEDGPISNLACFAEVYTNNEMRSVSKEVDGLISWASSSVASEEDTEQGDISLNDSHATTRSDYLSQQGDLSGLNLLADVSMLAEERESLEEFLNSSRGGVVEDPLLESDMNPISTSAPSCQPISNIGLLGIVSPVPCYQFTVSSERGKGPAHTTGKLLNRVPVDSYVTLSPSRLRKRHASSSSQKENQRGIAKKKSTLKPISENIPEENVNRLLFTPDRPIIVNTPDIMQMKRRRRMRRVKKVVSSGIRRSLLKELEETTHSKRGAKLRQMN